MFGISFSELLLVGLVALLVLGPERLPGAARTAGLWIGRLKRSFNTIKQEVEREIGADEIRRQLHNEHILSMEREAQKLLAPLTGQNPPQETPPPAAENPAPSVPTPPPTSTPADAAAPPAVATSTPPSPPSEHDQEMPLVSHLTELRTRLLRSVAAIFLIFAGLFYFSQKIYTLVSEPLRRFLPEGTSMIATDVASPFLAPFKLTMVVALFLAMPVILAQVWGFIAPGLYKHEKRVALPLLVSSIILFYAGMAFAYFLVFPMIFHFFASVTPEGVAMMTDINSYLDFVLTLFFAFGVAFEIPVATVLLIWIGVVDVEYLKKIRPYVIIGCFVVGMVLTPPDIFSQTMLAVPMWLLFEIGLLFGRLVRKRGEHPDDQPASDGDQPPATRQ